jgi:hypothetical protein
MVDFRSNRMKSAEGGGIARRAWDSYANAVKKVTTPILLPVLRPYTSATVVDLFGFWVVWHLHGGFEGLQQLGMSRPAIFRRVSMFRQAFGEHPDTFEMPGVILNRDAYWAAAKKPPAK